MYDPHQSPGGEQSGLIIPLPDLDATARLAKNLAPHLRSGDVVALTGPLGAGKTGFARSLLRVLGITGEVPSPTFTLLQTYEAGKLTISHFDLYRLKSADELEELGWDDALAASLVLVEWPERAGRRLPKHALTLRFAMDGKGVRSCGMEMPGVWAQRLKDFKP